MLSLVNLSKFLKELNFNESLTQNDLDMIYHKLIVSKHWLSLWLKYYELQKLCNKAKTIIPNYQLNIIKEISQIHNGLPNNHETGFETIKRKSKIKNGN